ncbi:MAG: hypothetical protein WB554_00800, partial [Desulfomonilaceae bacterium]
MSEIESKQFVITNFVIVITCVALLVYLAVRKVECLIGIYCSSMYLLSSVKLGPIMLLYLVFMLMIIGTFLLILKKKISISSLLKYDFNIILLAFVLFLWMNLNFISTDIEYGEKSFKYFCYFSLIPYVLLQLGEDRSHYLNGFMIAFIASCAAVAVLTYSMFDAKAMLERGTDRLSLFVDPITFAIPFAMSCIFLLYFFFKVTKFAYRMLISGLFITFFIFIMLSGTRQIFFGMFLCIGVFFYHHSKLRSAIYLVILFCSIAMIYHFLNINSLGV